MPPPVPGSKSKTSTTVPNSAQPRTRFTPLSAVAVLPPPPPETFVEWHRRKLKILHWFPSVLCWIPIAVAWSYCLGFLWIPAWYFIDKADGSELTSKFKSLMKRIPVGKCLSCAENWAREIIAKQFLGEQQGYDDVTRCDEHYATRPASLMGERVGETIRREQVVVTIRSFLLTCHCKQCGHTWNEHSSER